MKNNHEEDISALGEITTLAATLTANGRAHLRLRCGSPFLLARIGAAAERLQKNGVATPPAMEWLCGNVHMIEVLSQDFARERTRALPAREKTPRIQILMRLLIAGGDRALAPATLCDALEAFDRVQGLTMAEIWLAPAALRRELVCAFYETAVQTLSDQRARAQAEEWVGSGAPKKVLQRAPGCAFCERALQLMHERESPEGQAALLAYLESREGGTDAVIRRAHERQALQRLRFENILSTLRALACEMWSERFEALSRCEKVLRADPLYKNSDEPTRELLRGEVCKISRASGLSELTVARHALEEAQRAESGARSSVCWWLLDDAGRRALLHKLGCPEAFLPARTPDPTGRGYLLSHVLLTALRGRGYVLEESAG